MYIIIITKFSELIIIMVKYVEHFLLYFASRNYLNFVLPASYICHNHSIITVSTVITVQCVQYNSLFVTFCYTIHDVT
jgi:hypothetical protein